MSKIVSILSTQRYRECQGFIEKVGETRFIKVKQRQLNKFKNLLNKKERNITGVSTQFNSSHGLPTSQGQCHFPGSWHTSPGRLSSFPGRQAVPCSQQFSGFSGKQSGRQAVTQAGSQAVPLFPGTVLLPRQAAQSTPITLQQGKVLPRQAITSPHLRQAGSKSGR